MISVSYIKSNYNRIETIKKIDNSLADFIHVDLMDGIYVEENNFKIEEVMEELKNTNKLLDIHLMVKEPLKFIKELVHLNVWAITFHLDATKEPEKIINYIKENNIKVGIAINPQDDITLILPYINKVDYVLIMSVVPGKGGQKFIPEVLSKVKFLENQDILIGIDGGINSDTIKMLKQYRIDNIICGSYICLSSDFNEKINILKKAVNE